MINALLNNIIIIKRLKISYRALKILIISIKSNPFNLRANQELKTYYISDISNMGCNSTNYTTSLYAKICSKMSFGSNNYYTFNIEDSKKTTHSLQCTLN